VYPRHTLDRRLGGSQNRSERCGGEKILAIAGNGTLAVQPVKFDIVGRWSPIGSTRHCGH
jgi:hypothetical protein